MNDLASYIQTHVERGSCQCGRCADVPANPKQPIGHTADVAFFKVKAINDPDAETLKDLIVSHKGEFNDVDLFDKYEHGYIEIGGWIGDQGLALMLMGLGALTGLWKLLTPRSMLGDAITEEMVQDMAGAGYVTIQAK
jgi:hypothetical protein